MLTPSFELSQNDKFVTVVIKARYAKVTEAEIFIEGKDFKFYSKPYFLRLTLPGNVIEDGRESAKYDVDKGFFTVSVAKETPGEHFDGLDMLTKLLAPAGSDSAKELTVEIIDDSKPVDLDGDEEQTGNTDEDEDDEDIDWQVAQQPFKEDEMTMGGSCYYGFANRRTGVFARLQDELCGIVDVPDPDHMNGAARREARQLAEQQKFDEDHYVADFMDDECIQSMLQFKMPWDKDLRRLMKAKRGDGDDTQRKMESNVILTDEEKERMIKLPKKQYLLDQGAEATVMLGLVDIMFAYCYDMRISDGDHSVESPWTICKLSSTLSWLETFNSMDDVISACFTRALSYPLYRHWQLNLEVLKDVIGVFHLGRTQLLKCLLDIYQLLSQDEPRYILNDLYITDYCVWVQSLSHDKILSLAQTLENQMKTMTKSKVTTLNLEDLERLTLETVRQGGDGNHGDEEEDSTDSDDDTDTDDDGEEETEEEDSEDDSEECEGDDGVVVKKPDNQANTIYQYGYPHILRKSESSVEDSSSSNATKVSDVERELKPNAEDSLASQPRTCVCSTTSNKLCEQCDEGIGHKVDRLQTSDNGDVLGVDVLSAAVGTITLDDAAEGQLDSNVGIRSKTVAETGHQSSESCDAVKEQCFQESEMAHLVGDKSSKNECMTSTTQENSDKQLDVDDSVPMSDVRPENIDDDLIPGESTSFETWVTSPPTKKVEMF